MPAPEPFLPHEAEESIHMCRASNVCKSDVAPQPIPPRLEFNVTGALEKSFKELNHILLTITTKISPNAASMNSLCQFRLAARTPPPEATLQLAKGRMHGANYARRL